MLGGDERFGSLFSYVDLEARVGPNHPLRAIRLLVNEALAGMAGEFSALYPRISRPSIPPKVGRSELNHTSSSIPSLLCSNSVFREEASRTTKPRENLLRYR